MKTFILQEVIDDLVNTDKSLTSSLMKLQYFGRLIKNEELIGYTRNELNGYKDASSEIPTYRKNIGSLYIDIQYSKYADTQTVELPLSMIDSPLRDALKYFIVREGIASVERLARDSEKSEGQLAIPIPMELLPGLQKPARKLYKGYGNAYILVVGARLVGNPNTLVEIPPAIRSRLLEFVMSLAEEFGYDIEIETFNSRNNLNNQIIIHQMNTKINNSGDGNVINTGNQNEINNKANIFKGNEDRLSEELKKQGIDDDDIQEITEIVNKEDPDFENKRLGNGANNWISGIINKSLNGVGKVSTGISANLLATLIKEYYGMV